MNVQHLEREETHVKDHKANIGHVMKSHVHVSIINEHMAVLNL